MGITQYALENTVVRTEWSASLAFDSQCQVNNKWQMIDFCSWKKLELQLFIFVMVLVNIFLFVA
jgi:hypothetical protein